MKKENLIEIKEDLFNISKSIKAIDNKYRLYFNNQKKRYELYSLRGMNLNLEVVCNYEKLDNRFLLKVKKTRVENAKKMLEQMELENQKLIQNRQNKLINENKIKAKEMIDYGNKKSVDIDFTDAYKNQWF